MMRAPGPLRAGPVRVEGFHGPQPAGGQDEEIRLAILAALALDCLARNWDQPW